MIAKRLISTKDLSREEWLKWRNSGIGSSDAAAAVGMSKWKTPWQLYMEKRGEAEPDDLSDNEAVEMGILLEPIVAELFMRREGKRVESVHAILQHPDYPWMLANLDRRVVGESAVLECKTAGAFAAMRSKEWGDPENEPDAVPEQYLIQCQHQLAVTGLQRAYIAVLIGGQKTLIYTIERDEALINNLISREQRFWQDVQDGVEPEITTIEDLKAKYPTSVENYPIQATESIALMVQRYKDLKEQVKAGEEEIAELQVSIGSFMGDHDELRAGDTPLMTYKTQSKKEYTAVHKATTFRVMRPVKAKAKKL